MQNNDIKIIQNLLMQQNKKKQIKALRTGIKGYMTKNNSSLRYDIFHHSSASSVNLQVIDYIGWAIHRKYEMDDDRFYEKIKEYLIDEDIVTKERDNYYEK